MDAETKKVEVAPTTAQSITLSSDSYDDATYVKLGDLSVSVNKTTVLHADPTVEAVQAKLREDAAKLGATHVYNVVISDVEISAFSWVTRTGTGVAVKRK